MAKSEYGAAAGSDAWQSQGRNQELAIIWPLLGRHIAFHRRLVDLTANVKAALMLSQAIYWTRHGRDIAMNDGWFFKTGEQWAMETGLSAKEQATARELLRDLALLGERRIGLPARLHFRLCVDQLGELLFGQAGDASRRLDWTDGAAVAELLGPSLSFHRVLAGVAGGVHAGLLLSRALYLTRLQMRRQLDAWIANSSSRWTHEIGLSRREQEAARRELMRAGLWEESLTGIPARLVARIRLECLLDLLARGERGTPSGLIVPSGPECGIPAANFPQNGESRVWESHIPDLPKAPNLIRRNRHHSFAESAKLHIQRSTSVSVQQPPAVDARAVQTRSHGSGDLIFPDALIPEERASARRMLAQCPDQAQALLDELSARMQAKAIHTGPIAYLRGLVRRAAACEFVPELGPRVAAARRKRQAELIERRQREEEERRLAAERATPEYQAKAAERREKIRQMLNATRSQSPKGRAE